MKCVLIVMNGKEYTEEDFREAMDAVINTWEEFKESVSNVIEKVWKLLTNIMKVITDNPPIGYKRILNSDRLQYYKSISAGKSNNWRKMHGLPLIRQLKSNA